MERALSVTVREMLQVLPWIQRPEDLGLRVE